MFGSQILDVVFGLIFVFWLLSLICLTLNEWIARIFALRSKTLEAGIQNLINGKDKDGNELLKLFYEHHLIKRLNRPGKELSGGNKPSYISSQDFALVLIDILAPKDNAHPKGLDDINEAALNLPEGDTKKALLLLIKEAGNDYAKLHENIEKWFDQTMDRVSGWYKRKIQLITLVVALIVSVGLNVDTFMLSNGLYRDASLRATVVAAASEAAKQPGAVHTDSSLNEIKTIKSELEQLNVPMGWSGQSLKSFTTLQWVSKIFGWLFTTFALFLGAPFWFDVLSKFTNLRSTGVKPKQ